MQKIALITDTNASLPPEIIKKYHIIQVRIHIQFGDECYITGVTIDDEKLFEMVDARQLLPTTAAPAPAAFQQAYQDAFDAGAEKIICICCSSEVSATYNAAQMAREDFPGNEIAVVDSRQLSLAEGYQVIAAAEAVLSGAKMEEILSIIEDIQGRIHVYAALPTLKYLAMGGRMGKLAAGLADTMNIKPILSSNNGKLDLLEKIRTWRKAKKRLVELAVASTAGSEIEKIGMIHVNNEDGAFALFEMLQENLHILTEPLYAEFTQGLSVHTGSGVIGFVIVTKN